MLPIPSDTNCIVNVVGIDPGTETLGVGIVSFDINTFEIVRCEAMTFRGSRMPGSEWLGLMFNDRAKRIQAHQINLLQLLLTVNPICVACESPFINMRQPTAYGALTEVVVGIAQAVRDFDVWRPLYMVSPPQVKQAVGAPGNADKETVKAKLLAILALVSVCTTDPSMMDEHSIDALAVAYYQYLNCRESRFTTLI